MRVCLLWVGRTKDGNLGSAIRGYIERIERFIPVDVLEVKEEVAADRHSETEARIKEGRRLREKIPADTEVAILDSGGREYSSEEFSRFLEKRFGASSSVLKGLTFVIGGHLGLDDDTKKIAHHTISLSRMTFTHEMARLLAVEQIYRGISIMHGGRYHRR